MTRDPNSFKADVSVCKREINKERLFIKEQANALNEKQMIIDSLVYRNQELQNELGRILNSKGWKTLEKARKIIPRKKAVEAATEESNTIEDTPEKRIHSTYNSHYEDNFDFSKLGYKPEVKALAFYLPQFHTFPENDRWWGKGFMEWTNTKKAKPDYEGHYEPREPHDDIGYYTLDNAETIKKQVELAKQHGIYGFCFYYYWFSGKRLMEKPLDLFLEDKTIDFPFCFCWANENWTRRWDGKDKEVLIEQKYEKDDPRKFILDMKKYLVDSRYIRVDGKPVILVYEPDSIPDFEDVVKEWREVARKEKIGEILVWSKNKTYDCEFKNADFVDAEFDFAPTGHVHFLPGAMIDSKDGRDIVDYSKFVENARDKRIYYDHMPVKPFYYSCTMGWDNSPRKKNYFSFGEYSPEKFYDWLRLIIEETKRRFPNDQRFVFINAWNEWAEGTYLEPDKKYGYTNINTAAKAIYGLPYNHNDAIVLDKKSDDNVKNKKIAVQVHAFYLDVFEEFLDCLEKMPGSFDLYISTDEKWKKVKIEEKLRKVKFPCKTIKVQVFENVGRDVYPFLTQLKNDYKKYDIIGHFHTKKTITEPVGDLWREHIYHTLFGSTENIKRILALFNDKEIGLVAPTDYCEISHELTLGANLEMANEMLKKMGLAVVKDAKQELVFPVGTMFWARADAIQKIFDLGLTSTDFPQEAGQADGTLAHAMERLFGIVPEQSGYKVVEIINKNDE